MGEIMKNFSAYDVSGIEFKKQNLIKLKEILTEKWLSDRWDVFHMLSIEIKSSSNINPLTFTKNELINLELKYAAYKVLSSSATWNRTRIFKFLREIRLLISYLNSIKLDTPSLILMDYRQVVDGINKYSKENSISRTTNKDSITLLNKIVMELLIFYDNRDEFLKDVWNVDRLGISNNPARPTRTLNFQGIYPDWLKSAFKKYLKLNIHLLSANTIKGSIWTLEKLSIYLKENYPHIKSSEVTRNIILDHISELKNIYNEDSLHSIVSRYKVFFDFFYFNDRSNYPKRIILTGDIPKKSKSLTRSIPYDVIEQLEKNLDGLQRDMFIMLKIIMETGIRPNELVTLEKSCVITDEEGDSYLRSFQHKTKRENIIPISKEVATLIYEQVEHVNKKWGQTMKYLFPNSKGKPYAHQTISNKINQLIKKKEIKTEEGDDFHFRMHEVRHTVGTRMINNGVPQHIVQKYLGHQNPTMTTIYAKVHDSTLKNEILPKSKILIDINGSIDEDTERIESNFYKNVYNQILPNGYCALSIDISCPHSNACLTCTHFRTDHSFLKVHLNQIEKTSQLIEIAKQKKLERQIQTNTDILNNLNNIVQRLTMLEGK